MKWYFEVLRNYWVFSGRSGRSAYWYFFLFHMLAIIVLTLLDVVLDTFNVQIGLGWLSGIYVLATLAPALGVSVRRLHDIGRSGWWQLLYLTVIGSILVIVWHASAGEAKANEYGEYGLPV